MNWPELISILGIGSIIGGAVGAYFQTKFQHQKQIQEFEYKIKERRYLSINIFLLAKLDVAGSLPFLNNIRPDIQTEDQLDKEIEVEFYNSFLFANDDVIKAIKSFLNSPSHTAYYEAAMAMRKDLWGRKTSLNPETVSKG